MFSPTALLSGDQPVVANVAQEFPLEVCTCEIGKDENLSLETFTVLARNHMEARNVLIRRESA